jgi:hypothetical protein
MAAATPSLSPAAPGIAAVREESESRGWRWATAALVLVIWLIPVKIYTLPVTLPFQLEVYRLLILAMLFAWFLARLRGGAQLTAGGLGRPLALLALASIASVFVGIATTHQQGVLTLGLKTLSYFLSFLIAFLLISSTIKTVRDIEVITAALVLGGAVVAIGAIYEYRTGYDIFDHLSKWLPILKQTAQKTSDVRQGRLRVYASSQHPIALGAALIMMTPLAFYLARRASTTLRKRLWQGAALLLAAGSAETQSRTVILMLCFMIPLALWLRKKAVMSYWPLLIVMLGAIHFVSPATISGLYKALDPRGGLVSQQETRAGSQGSGRLADLKPGLKQWAKSPVVGKGMGTDPSNTSVDSSQGGKPPPDAIVFDDQFMTSLVETGAVGLFAVLWFCWALIRSMARVAKKSLDEHGDLLAAYTIACVGFVVGMLTYDAFSFVQVTLIFFVCAALGLRVRTLILERDPLPSAAAPATAAAPSATQ